MDSVTSMTAAVRFIEEHLTDEITIGDVATAVHCSLYHFCRVFKRATLHTPYDYLMRRRLTKAARALVGDDARVIDIALDFCFANPETFTRAFRRMFSCSPSQFRKAGILDPLAMRPPLTDEHLAHLALADGLHPTPEDLPPLHWVGLMTLDHGEDQRNALWGFMSSLFEGHRGVGGAWSVTCYPEGWERHGPLYYAGVETKVPEDGLLVAKRLPAARYARFGHVGGAAARQLTLDTLHHTWLPQSGMRWAPRMVVERFEGLPSDGDWPVSWDVLVPVIEA